MGHCPQSAERWSSSIELVSGEGVRGLRAAALGCMSSSLLTMMASVSCLTSLTFFPVLLFICSPPSTTYVQRYIDENETTNSEDISCKCHRLYIISWCQRAEGIHMNGEGAYKFLTKSKHFNLFFTKNKKVQMVWNYKTSQTTASPPPTLTLSTLLILPALKESIMLKWI